MTTQPTPWPAGVTARYLTIGGATVDLRDPDEYGPARAWCIGCETSNRDGGPDWDNSKRWAQAHSERCRALPRPTA